MITVEGQTTYQAEKRTPAQYKLKGSKAVPFPVDQKTGKVEYCSTASGLTVLRGFDWSGLGEEYAPKRSGIILCAHTFAIDKRQKEYTTKDRFPPQLRHEVDLSPQPLDTDLYLMGTNALILYHE